MQPPPNDPNLGSESEDDFPDFANDENKKLNQLIKEKKRNIKRVKREFEKDFERKKILEEHLRNVDQQLLHTKSLIDAKNKETQTENHMWQVTERQTGRLESEIRKLHKAGEESKERLNDVQVRIVKVNEKVEQVKLELNWNQEELEQWAITGKQKEEDNVTLEKYKKEDDTKIRQLSLQIEKLTMEVGRKQQDLERQITATQASQIQLDKTAEEFKKEQDQRHKLFEKWQDVTKTISRRDQDINNLGEQFSVVMQQIEEEKKKLDEKARELNSQKKMNKEEEAKNMMANRAISDKKNQNKAIEFEEISNLQAEVQILKNQLSSFSTDLASKRNLVNSKNQQLLQKKQRLQNQEAKFNAYQFQLSNEKMLVERFGQEKSKAEGFFKEKENEKKKVEQQIALQKQMLVKASQQLHKLRQEEQSLYGEIQGILAACRNLKSHINKLNQEFQKQQELLYNAEYQIQLMERKVARARGERTLEEKKDLQRELDTATAKNTEVKTQRKILNESVKKLNEDLRAVEANLGEIRSSESKLSSLIEQLSLENDMTTLDLNKITKSKQEVLVQHDIMKLEIKKIKDSLSKATDHVYSTSNKKNQLEMTMQEREKEIQVHRDVLLAEHKAIEDERHKIAIELAERKNKVKNLRIKYESLVQKVHGSQEGEGEHSQAYYVIRASQEKEELQRKVDQLGAKTDKAERELKALQNTMFSLVRIYQKKKERLAVKGVSQSDIEQKDAVEEQCNAASENLAKKRNEFKKLTQQYDQQMKRLVETQNRIEMIREQKQRLEMTLNQIGMQLAQNDEKVARAAKSLDIMMKNVAKKKLEIGVDNPHMLQLEFDIENDKYKTLVAALMQEWRVKLNEILLQRHRTMLFINSIVPFNNHNSTPFSNLGSDLPELGPIIEETLKEHNIQIESKAPSAVDVMSSKGSIRSGGSAISRASRGSRQ